MNDPRLSLPALILVVCLGCDTRPTSLPVQPPAKPAAPPAVVVPRAGISELEPGATLPTAAGQSIYVPVYTQIAAEEGHPVTLTVTVSVRNTDETRPIIVTALRHRDADGRTVRDYLRTPARLAPKATLDVVLKEADPGGNASSVFVEWVADRAVAVPIVESVMIGKSSSPALAFTERGRVIEDRQHPTVPPR